jgi:hypothetical protein
VHLCYSGIELPSGIGRSPLLFHDGGLRLAIEWYICSCTCLVCSLLVAVFVLHFHSCSLCCKWYTHAKGAQIFQKYRHQKGNMKQVPYFGPTNIRHHHTKFSCRGSVAPMVCAPLLYTFYCKRVTLKLFTYPNFPTNFRVFTNICCGS